MNDIAVKLANSDEAEDFRRVAEMHDRAALGSEGAEANDDPENVRFDQRVRAECSRINDPEAKRYVEVAQRLKSEDTSNERELNHAAEQNCYRRGDYKMTTLKETRAKLANARVRSY
jgi:hypothetical protein